MDTIEVINLKQFSSPKGVSRLLENELSVYTYKTTGITFNHYLSSELKERGNVYLYMAKNPLTDETFLILTSDSTNPNAVRLSAGGVKDSNLKVVGVDVIKHIITTLKIELKKGERKKIIISKDLSNDRTVSTFKVVGLR